MGSLGDATSGHHQGIQTEEQHADVRPFYTQEDIMGRDTPVATHKLLAYVLVMPEVVYPEQEMTLMVTNSFDHYCTLNKPNFTFVFCFSESCQNLFKCITLHTRR